jgi:predicted O-linked N-acetylglucosamine transferase (SPINDLY family)
MRAKTKLRVNRLTTDLFDTESFSRHLEDAYRQIYGRYQAGQGASDTYIDQ